jgi:hypothetical protein
MTKVFTGILLADMVRRGVVELADPLAELLPPAVPVPSRSGKHIYSGQGDGSHLWLIGITSSYAFGQGASPPGWKGSPLASGYASQ